MRVKHWLALSLFPIAILAVAYHIYLATPDKSYVHTNTDALTSLTFFALGDQGTGGKQQRAVADSMSCIGESIDNLAFVVLLGDNFYSPVSSSEDATWNWKFEDIYSGESLEHLPFYAVLGNHDSNPDAELQYSAKKHGSGRWRMPAHYYSEDFGTDNGHPLLRIVFLDSDLQRKDFYKQLDFIRQAFADDKPQPTWRAVAAHHPVRNFGKHGELPRLIKEMLPVLQASHVDLYLSGHDHTQQFIHRDNEPYYVISGGGGQTLYTQPAEKDGLIFGKASAGFARVDVSHDQIVVSFYDEKGNREMHYAIDRKLPSPTSINATPSPAQPAAGMNKTGESALKTATPSSSE